MYKENKNFNKRKNSKQLWKLLFINLKKNHKRNSIVMINKKNHKFYKNQWAANLFL